MELGLDIITTIIGSLSERISSLESKETAIFEIKTTTGDSAPRGNYHFVSNEFDNTFKVYLDGGWRTLVSW